MKREFTWKEITLICVAIGACILAISFSYFRGYPQVFGMLNFSAAMIALGLPVLYHYQTLRIRRKIEEAFPQFLHDVTNAIETGMTLPQAFRVVKHNDYGPLSKYVREMAAKLEWGIDFERVLNDFASKVRSPTITRSIRAIIEIHRSGGYIGTILEAVAESQTMIERIKKERAASVYSQMINGYVIFFVFLGVMFGLSNYLVPAFQWEAAGGITGLGELYRQIFRNLIVIQGVFAGLAIGKMSEGSVFAGIKHSLVLVSVGYTIFTLLG